MSTDFAPVFEKKFHARVLPGLLLLMDDNANPRVQAHAGAALVNFRLLIIYIHLVKIIHDSTKKHNSEYDRIYHFELSLNWNK